MTPEDTPRMAERTDRQAQIDPWDSVHEEFADMSQWETARVYRADAVDAARAADAALLRERDAQIASLQEFRDAVAGALCVENPFGEINDAAIIEAADATLSQVFEFSAELTTLRAERDAAQQEIAEQQRDYAILSKMMARETEMLRDEEQENTTLRETLQAAWCELIQHDDQPWVKTLAGQVRVVGLFASPRPQEPQP